MSTTTSNEPFTSREEIVKFIEDQAESAVQSKLSRRVERRIPWVTSGPVGQDSAGYSVLKAAAFTLGYVGAEQAKEEIHTHQQLRDLYSGYGFMPHHGAQSFLVPLSSELLPVFEPQGRRLQAELRQKMSATAGQFDPDEADWLRRRGPVREKSLSLAGENDAFLQMPVLGEMIELQRHLEAFSTAGAREIALPPHGRITFPKITGSSSAYWVGEGNPITESQPSTGNLELQAKKLGVLVKLNNELLRFASPSAEALVRYDMARTAALKADLAMLEGSGPTQIKGLLTYSGLPKHVASDPGADGDLFTPEDIARMEAKLPDAVDGPTAWLMRKTMFAALMNRRTDRAEAGDREGAFLFSPNRSLAGGPPQQLFGTPVVRSSQVSATRTKGDGEDLTYILLGYFPDWIVARLGVMEFLAGNQGDTALQNDMTYLRGIQHIDAGPRRLESFLLCDQLRVE
ncbi:MAG: phage major capsid protein [Fimbriiglobus sp.]